MALANDVHGKFDDAQAQIARLREQVEALMKDRVTPAVADLPAGRRAPCTAQAASFATRPRRSPGGSKTSL